MADALPVFDTDTHIIEPRGTWDAVRGRFAASRLRIGIDRGRDHWLMRGRKKIHVLRGIVPGEIDTARASTREDPLAFEKMRAQRALDPPRRLTADPRHNDLAARPELMDEMGVARAVLFPSLSLFWSSIVADPDYADAHYAAWNRWIAAHTEELREHLLPVAQYTLHHPKKAAAEIRRCHALGLRGLFVPAVPYRDLPWDHPSYEPVWDALTSCDMPLLLHFTVMRNTSIDAAWETELEKRHVGAPVQAFVNRALPAEAVLTSLIMGGVLERHPRLRVGVIEFGSIWVPSFLHRLDFALDFLGPRNRYLRERLPLRPSEYFRRQVKVSTIWYEPLEWLIRSAGENVLMFASDFPHPEGNAGAVELARKAVGSLPRATRRRFFHDNARELFG